MWLTAEEEVGEKEDAIGEVHYVVAVKIKKVRVGLVSKGAIATRKSRRVA